ncbi:gamma-glutamyl-gamma-aminobutyrate hydrolase family protein [Burkholderia oklahomensis]|uniref:gamma-glutamyl-gamma-aminobutyrate hydrolase family protein n=2 Tax=Burkholderia oklahomensis TaxID=342113 RepID=UPI0005D92F88|nr:type 1 glutamine amidotransferase [Burkholderia oklahomensis]AJX31891.1 peptidase C26 family protein [Burkholderia oklahomensis C6786]AOI45252.1 glutamine amidotransferase [Burkholderia oklahomensis C6786]KUY59555.1 glutamine amidotransferase [Burkholderia oklahomensis C6786]MBI0358684.1 type 1 glutamine amidotransferase [Burkholderia oklahomensis]MDN7672279.1 type 1 glutamine amidotransferase [Burkholderia oklahomensis]
MSENTSARADQSGSASSSVAAPSGHAGPDSSPSTVSDKPPAGATVHVSAFAAQIAAAQDVGDPGSAPTDTIAEPGAPGVVAGSGAAQPGAAATAPGSAAAGAASSGATGAGASTSGTTAAGATASTAKNGSPPPGFGAQPDFETPRPPPASAASPAPPAYLKQSDTPWSVFGRIVAARARRLFDRAGQRITQRTLRIGVSARIFHPEPGAPGLRGKTLQYLEESIAHWVMSRNVLVFMIPTVGHQGMLHPSNIRLRDYAKHLDGLLLQGGADVSPQTYAAADARPEWPGDRVRDMYELELLHEFIESGKPVLGVCRGCQLINVAFGGSLYQDIASDVPTAGVHVSEHYDQHRHAIRFPDGSTLANMFPGRREAIVNSIHHQAIRDIGRDLNIEAVSAEDGIIEGIRYRRAPFVVGVQWHPEFHRAGGPELLDCTPLLDTFLRAARETRL